jgi:CrcB protein
MLYNILSVAVGGAIGSVGRYLVVRWVTDHVSMNFPWGTLTVNAFGGVAIGIIAGIFVAQPALPPELRLFLITGILGGFTTFSAFSLEVVQLAGRGAWIEALTYIVASVVLAVAAAIAGLQLARWVAS